MKNTLNLIKIVVLLFGVSMSNNSYAQAGYTINTTMLEGVDLNRENVINFQVISTASASKLVTIIGDVIFGNKELHIGYRFQKLIQPGINNITIQNTNPQWTFSNSALKDLFINKNSIPSSGYEYCIKVFDNSNGGESDRGLLTQECLYKNNQDLFLINLIEPSDDSKIYEYFPSFTWICNSPLLNEVSYKIKVAEIKKGQNAENAIVRNNAIFEEGNLRQTNLVYPYYARPLKVSQPYAWIIYAYYNGILLGRSEAWKFTIIEDSLLKAVQKDPSYIEVNLEHGKYTVYAPGLLKLKYILNDYSIDNLSMFIITEDNKKVPLKEPWSVVFGDNRKELLLDEKYNLKHKKNYQLQIVNGSQEIFVIKFMYINPIFLK